MKLNVILCVFLSLTVIGFAIGDYNHLSAADKPKVHSANFKGEKENKFKTNESVYVEGRKFKPLTNVDIYVAKNKRWRNGDQLFDISTDGIETVQTTSSGNIPKTRVWGSPIIKGNYDIVVDANQDGTFNTGDAADKESANPGFKVKRFLP